MELEDFFELCEKYNITNKGSLRNVNCEDTLDLKNKTYILNTEKDILEKYFNSLSFKNSFHFDYFKNIKTIRIHFSSDLSLYDCTQLIQISFEDKTIKILKDITHPVLYREKSLVKEKVKIYFEFLSNLKEDLDKIKDISFKAFEQFMKKNNITAIEAPLKEENIGKEEDYILHKMKGLCESLFTYLPNYTIIDVKHLLQEHKIQTYSELTKRYEKVNQQKGDIYSNYIKQVHKIIYDIISGIDKDINFQIVYPDLLHFSDKENNVDMCFTFKIFQKEIFIVFQYYNIYKALEKTDLRKAEQFYGTVMQDYQTFEKKNKNGEYNSLIEDKTDYDKVYTEFKRLENLTNTLNCLKQVFC